MNDYLDRLNLRPFEKRLVVGVAAMVFVVVNIWFVLPHFSDWSRTKARLKKAEDTLNNFQGEIGQMASMQRQVITLQKETPDVPTEESAYEFQHAVQNQAIESKVELPSLQKLTSRTNQFFLELTLNVSVLSTEADLVDFLYKLGAGDSLIRVRDLGLHTDMAHQRLNANVKLVASYQKAAPPRRGATTTQPTPATTRVQPQRAEPKDARPPIDRPQPNRPATSPGAKPAPSNPKKQ